MYSTRLEISLWLRGLVVARHLYFSNIFFLIPSYFSEGVIYFEVRAENSTYSIKYTVSFWGVIFYILCFIIRNEVERSYSEARHKVYCSENIQLRYKKKQKTTTKNAEKNETTSSAESSNIGRFWGRDCKFQFRTYVRTKWKIADDKNNY